MEEAAKRRVRAGRLLQAGKRPAEVAVAVGVARQTVYTWKRILDEQGIDALRQIDRGGRPGSLNAEQFEQIRRALLQGPAAHGLGTERWTLKRIRVLIERLHGKRFSEVHVWRILARLGFSSPKPERRALERDEPAIVRWKQCEWPRLKKGSCVVTWNAKDIPCQRHPSLFDEKRSGLPVGRQARSYCMTPPCARDRGYAAPAPIAAGLPCS